MNLEACQVLSMNLYGSLVRIISQIILKSAPSSLSSQWLLQRHLRNPISSCAKSWLSPLKTISFPNNSCYFALQIKKAKLQV